MCSIILDKCFDIEWGEKSAPLEEKSSNSSHYRPDIDGLRGLAVSFVLMIHFNFPYITGGFVGVDIFFVISGYLITSTLLSSFSNGGNLKTFYLKRFYRLFPALFVVLFSTTIMSAAFLSPDQLKDFGRSLMASMTSVSNFFFWTGAGYFDASAETKPLLHTWSLGMEEQFYLIWPLLLWWCVRRSHSFLGKILVGAAVLSLSMNYVVALGWVPNVDIKASLYFLLPFRIYEFAIGALLVLVDVSWLHDHWGSSILFWVGLCHVFYSAFTFSGSMVFPLYYALIPCIGTAMLIVSGDKCASGRVLSNPLLVGLGVISYSLYLVHWPIVVFAKSVLGKFYWDDRIALMVLCIILAMGLYYTVEKPLRDPKSRIRQSSAFQPLFLLAFIVLFVIGGTMAYSRLWLWRIPKIPGVVIDDVGGRGMFHKQFYGGQGYENFGAINTTAPADIVLMGDSHGMHYMEGVNRLLAQGMGLSLYSASGYSCFHFPHFTRTTAGVDWDKVCPDALKHGLEYVRQGNAPLVIVSHYWVGQVSIAGILDDEGKRTSKVVEMADVVKGILDLKAAIGESQLVVIGEVPSTGQMNTYDEFTKPRLANSIPYEDIQTTLVDPINVKINNELREAAKASDHAFVFLDPHDVLCSNGRCRNVAKNGHLIYSDENHLSKYGSVEVIEGFLPTFKSLLWHRG